MKFTFFILLYVFVTFAAFSFGRREGEKKDSQEPPVYINTVDIANQANAGAENTIKIIGRIQIYGNEPNTFVGIVDENGAEYAVYAPAREEELRKLQGHLINFTVVFLYEPQGYGSLFLKGGTVMPIEWEIIR
jgi:hypothetical protein